jgi:hypothetical protein
MSGRYNLVKEFIVKPVAKVVKDAFKSRGKNPTPGTINTVPIAKNLTTKRNIQDKVVAAVDKGVKAANVPPSLRGTQSASKMKKDKSKELKGLSYRMDKLTEKKAKGGRVGLKRGTGLMNKKSDIQKIKETFSPKKSAAKKSTKFGMLSVKAGIDKNPNPTQADRIAGAKMKSKKRFV